MSSFKRKSSTKRGITFPGTRVSPASLSSVITSTGIPSLDDILGGGLPLSCSMLVAAPDIHSSYGDLVQKYFVAQGLSCKHDVCVVDQASEAFVNDLIWTPRSRIVDQQTTLDEAEDDGNAGEQNGHKIKIAWRYAQMKEFQTSVSSPSLYSAQDFCHPFDLTSRIPDSVIKDARESGQLSFIATQQPNHTTSAVSHVLSQLSQLLRARRAETTSVPLRICILSLGSPSWGELTDQDILYFLHSLRRLLRRYPHACAAVGLPPQISADTWGGTGWMKKLGWLNDAAFTLSAFSGDPSLTAAFPAHHGLLEIHALPAPHTLVPLSDRFSTLRGISATAASPVGSGENNLTFKSTRKRLIFETLHLDIEGGVGERRTTPSSTSQPVGPTLEPQEAPDHTSHLEVHKHNPAFASMEVVVEAEKSELVYENPKEVENAKPKKSKKRVAFHSDRPELYDF